MPSKLLFPKIGGKLCIITYSDAGFWNLVDQISSRAGHPMFLTNVEEREAVPLAWFSNKVKRVVGSMPTAKALILQEAVSPTIYLRAILAKIMGKKVKEIPIYSYVDSNNLYQAVYSTKFVEDKWLRLDIAQVQECIKKEALQVRWVQSSNMLADCLTKRGVNLDKLMDVIKTGKLQEKKKEVE